MIPKMICPVCVNYIGEGKCKAFKQGIPKEILSGKNDHSKPLKDQGNDIIFKAI